MKRIFKSRVFLVIITIILTASVSVTASVLYNSSEIGFTPTDPNWKVNNLNDAINDLYSNKGMSITSSTTSTEIYAGHEITDGATITNVENYNSYIIMIEEYGTGSSIDNFKELLGINATNATLIEIGSAYRNRSGYRIALSYFLIPDGSGNDIVISHRAVDSMTVYGIK